MNVVDLGKARRKRAPRHYFRTIVHVGPTTAKEHNKVMATLLQEEQELAANIHKAAPVLEDWFTRLDGTQWFSRHDLTRQDQPNLTIELWRADGLSVKVHGSRFDKKAECYLQFPRLPDGSQDRYPATKLYEFLPYDERHGLPDRSANVSLDRLFNDPAKVAREFYRRVVAPNSPYWPKVLATVAERQAAVDKRDAVIAQLLAHFPGASVRERDTGSTRTIWIPNLPQITVSYGGGVSLVGNISGSPSLICKVLDLLARERSK